MPSKKTIIVLSTVIIILLLIIIGVFGYFLYQYEDKNQNSLFDQVETNRAEYERKKTLLDQKEAALDLEEDLLEQKYVNKEITYEEYKSKKIDIELREEKLEKEEDKLERKYGVDD